MPAQANRYQDLGRITDAERTHKTIIDNLEGSESDLAKRFLSTSYHQPAELGMDALASSWQRVTGKALPEDVRQIVGRSIEASEE